MRSAFVDLQIIRNRSFIRQDTHHSNLYFLCPLNMKARSIFFAVLFAVACTTSCSTLTNPTSASTSAAIPKSTPDTATGGHPQPGTDSLRERVLSQGINPDSPQGKKLIAFLTDLARNRETRGASANHGKPVSILALSADERLHLLHELNGAMNSTPDDCEAWNAPSRDIFALARTLSPSAFQSAIEIDRLYSSVRQPVHAEQYTTAELVEADVRLHAVPMPKDITDPRHVSQAQQCEITGAAVAAIDAMPPPLQGQATIEYIRKLSHQPIAINVVLVKPDDYLDEVFDERQLAESVRDRLPADGSIPVPFRHLTIDGEWISHIPGESGPVSDTFINRHDNGVIAELLTSSGTTKGAAWADFILTYGLGDLRRQSIWGNGYATPLAAVPDEQAVVPTPTHFAKGSMIDIPLPQPEPDASIVQRCNVEGNRSASTVFSSLSGVAIDMRCTSRTRDGKIVGEDQVVWLTDYHIALNMSWTIDGKAGRFVIHRIEVE